MRTHARVVVIGGVGVDVSILYHLAKKGWSDVVLCERTFMAERPFAEVFGRLDPKLRTTHADGVDGQS